MKNGVYGVVVTHNPDVGEIDSVLDRLASQVERVIIVDNGSVNLSVINRLVEQSDYVLIHLDKNCGLARAQNMGIVRAIEFEATHVLLMDQDTILPFGAVPELLDVWRSLTEKGLRIASVGHAYRDSQDKRLNLIWRAQGSRIIRKNMNASSNGIHEADFVIASGSLLPVAALKETGLMADELFIDLVDVEWGLRARSRGYRHFVSYRKIMSHTLGDGRMTIFGRPITLHKPLRNYYMVRNAILIARRRDMPTGWRIFYAKRVFAYLAIFGLFPKDRIARLRFMLRGLFDGLSGRSGEHH